MKKSQCVIVFFFFSFKKKMKLYPGSSLYGGRTGLIAPGFPKCCENKHYATTVKCCQEKLDVIILKCQNKVYAFPILKTFFFSC